LLLFASSIESSWLTLLSFFVDSLRDILDTLHVLLLHQRILICSSLDLEISQSSSGIFLETLRNTELLDDHSMDTLTSSKMSSSPLMASSDCLDLGTELFDFGISTLESPLDDSLDTPRMS